MPLYVCVWHYHKIKTIITTTWKNALDDKKERITPKLCNFCIKEPFLSQKCQCYKVTQKNLGLKWRVSGVSLIWVECERTIPKNWFCCCWCQYKSKYTHWSQYQYNLQMKPEFGLFPTHRSNKAFFVYFVFPFWLWFPKQTELFFCLFSTK